MKMSDEKPCQDASSDATCKEKEEKKKQSEEERIRSLKDDLEKELVLTSSLTTLVAEKTSEIGYLKGKISEQDARIRNLEDQIEEWTNQAEVCDKLLEQKDCELDMLKKTWNIEKQQRRDLEEMMMESGKENIKEKEQLEQQVVDLQCRLKKYQIKNQAARTDECEASKDLNDDMTVNSQEEGINAEVIQESVTKVSSTKEEEAEEDKQSPVVEELMADLFKLIKQNEELKEEIEKLKNEQVSMMESKREVITDLEKNLDEKAAENERQRHEIRRMSSTIELSGMEINSEREEMMKTLREEYEGKIEECDFLSAEWKARLDANDSEKDALVKEISCLSKKLDMEREQNLELNKQILEVSNLYDTYFIRCKEMEKGLNTENPTAENNDNIEKAGSESTVANEPGSFEDVGSQDFSGRENLKTDETRPSNADIVNEDFASSSSETKIISEDDEVNQTKTAHEEQSTPRISEELLNKFVSFFKYLCLIFLTILLVSIAHFVYHIEFKYVLSALAAFCIFLHNVRRTVKTRNKELQRESGIKPDNNCKLRRALQDAITRLDDENFQQFSKMYENFITETFTTTEGLPYGVQENVQFLKASKSTLEKELQSLKYRSQVTNKDYLAMKTEIDVLRAKRLDENEAKDESMLALKQEIKSLENQLNEKQSEVSESSESLPESEDVSPSKSMYTKYLFIVCCACLCVVYVDDLAVLAVLTLLFLPVTLMMYRTDKALESANSNMIGYKKTVRNLLTHVEESKKEGKQISQELKEMEKVIDKDYEIITKQRQAIERLERQLQRAIRKYQEKKKLTLRLTWLQSHGFGPTEAGELQSVDTDIGGYFKDESFSEKRTETERPQTPDDSTVLTKNRSMAKSGNQRYSHLLKSLSIITAAMLVFAGLVAWYPDELFNLISQEKLAAHDFMTISAPVLAIMFVVMALSQLNQLRKKGAKTSDNTRDSACSDEDLLNEHVDTLRELLKTERGVVQKLEHQIESSQKAPVNSIPSSEINAVVDKLIDLSKQRDQLQETADTTKNKYDNVKRTLEDILSREKYLSEEVASLRSQKRELQNDLMKEQVKHIDMFEEIKRLQGAESEVDAADATKVSGEQCVAEEHVFSCKEDIDQENEPIGKRKRKRLCQKDDSTHRKEEQFLTMTEVACIDADEASNNLAINTNAADAANAGDTFSAAGTSRAADTSDVGVNVTNDLWSSEGQGQGQGQMSNVKNESDTMKIDLMRMQEELTKEKLRNFELSEKNVALEIGQSLRNEVDCVDVDTVQSNDLAVSELEATSLFSEEHKFLEGEKARLKRQEALLQAKDTQLNELRDIINFINENRIQQNQANCSDQDVEQTDDQDKTFDLQPENKQQLLNDLNRLGKDIMRLKDICDGELKILGKEEGAMEPQEMVKHLIEQIGVFRYLISSDKASVTTKMNAMEEKTEELERHLACLNADIEKEKQARNDVIKEYEDEYERLEQRLTEAYEHIRKRLTEERVMRGQIMKQYEGEIEEIQSKTGDILKDLQHQLKQERKEREEAQYQSETIMKKVKSLELDLELIEAKSKAEVDIDAILSGVSVGELEREGDKNGNNKLGKKRQDIEQFKKAVDEETSKRTKMLKEQLDKVTKEISDYKNRLKERESVIGRFEKQEAWCKRKIDVQDKRMKDLEHEVRTSETTEIESLASEDNAYFGRDGVIGQLSTKYGGASWENSAITGVVQVTRSSAGFGNASDILDVQPLPCSTEDLEGSWFSVDLGEEISVIPESYALRHGWLSGDACLRSWVFEGSVDGNQWYTIQRHTMDTSFTERYSSAKWKVSETFRPLRRLRIRMTGRNSSNTNELYINGFEVFGKIVRS